jgi:hypothetical protein
MTLVGLNEMCQIYGSNRINILKFYFLGGCDKYEPFSIITY